MLKIRKWNRTWRHQNAIIWQKCGTKEIRCKHKRNGSAADNDLPLQDGEM